MASTPSPRSKTTGRGPTAPFAGQSQSQRVSHRPHRSHPHGPKTIQSALLPSTAFGELLSPVKSSAVEGALARSDGETSIEKGDEETRQQPKVTKEDVNKAKAAREQEEAYATPYPRVRRPL
jgi:hypothetical protein